MPANFTKKAIVYLAIVCGCVVAGASVGSASPTGPPAPETVPSGRRVAARALQRTRSTDWPTDVSLRLRLLEEHAERAARERNDPALREDNSMSRRSVGSMLALLAVSSALALAPDVNAQPYLPAPGGAQGADTGDSAAPFVGLADVPRADLFSGAATTRIPITVPAGRGNATPNLSLQYSSNAGASAYGYGWTLPIPRIFRSPRHGVPSFDSSDTFVISLGQVATDLAPIAGTPRYRTEPEGAYLRIGFDRDTNSWRVIDKGGTTFVFGADPAARLGPDIESPDRTASWLLTRSVDTFGNHVDYSLSAERRRRR